MAFYLISGDSATGSVDEETDVAVFPDGVKRYGHGQGNLYSYDHRSDKKITGMIV